MIAKDSRRFSATEHIEVGEEMTTCGHCGSRTEIIKNYGDGSRLECCLHCKQLYEVTDAPDNFEPSEMTLKEASQANLDHLFGIKRSSGWGSF